MMRTCFTIPMACLAIASIQAAEPPISITELAKITGYPAEKIRVEDGTERSNEQATRKKKPLCLSHHYYSSGDETFADISVAIGKRGTALTPELEAKFNKTLEVPNYPGNLRALTLGTGIKGFSGIGLAGGGGSMNRSVVSLSNHDRDIQITILFGENALTPLEGADAYQKSIVTAEGVNAIIEKCLTVVSNNVIASLSAGGTVPSLLPQRTAPATPPSDQTPMANDSTLATTPVPQPPALGVERRASVWPWVVGILAVIVIGGLALKRRA